MKERILEELKRQERTISWLSRKMKVSQPFVYNCLKSTKSLPEERERQICEILGIKK